MEREPAMVFCLVDRIMEIIKESGATFEQSLAALQSVQAILPVSGLRLGTDIVIHPRA